MLFSFQFSWIFDGAGEAIFRGQQHIPGGSGGSSDMSGETCQCEHEGMQ
jgi:hypothetical protein